MPTRFRAQIIKKGYTYFLQLKNALYCHHSKHTIDKNEFYHIFLAPLPVLQHFQTLLKSCGLQISMAFVTLKFSQDITEGCCCHEIFGLQGCLIMPIVEGGLNLILNIIPLCLWVT
jgi:hypothetical protein